MKSMLILFSKSLFDKLMNLLPLKGVDVVWVNEQLEGPSIIVSLVRNGFIKLHLQFGVNGEQAGSLLF